MIFNFICKVAFAFIIITDKAFAVYNKDVVCVIDIGEKPVCRTFIKSSRRTNVTLNNAPVYDPYIPRTNPDYYICPEFNCTKITLHSITQVTSLNTNLKCCFYEKTYDCERIRYNHLKNVDKLLFLSEAIPHKIYFMADCFIYSDGGRICNRNHGFNSHAMLVDLSTVARRNEDNILSQDEFLCEEDVGIEILCDLNIYIPYEDRIERKDFTNNKNNVLLKTGREVLVMQYGCRDLWCGFGASTRTRRTYMTRERYEPPGGHVYRCFSAKGQQVCKRLPLEGRYAYKERGWRSQ